MCIPGGEVAICCLGGAVRSEIHAENTIVAGIEGSSKNPKTENGNWHRDVDLDRALKPHSGKDQGENAESGWNHATREGPRIPGET